MEVLTIVELNATKFGNGEENGGNYRAETLKNDIEVTVGVCLKDVEVILEMLTLIVRKVVGGTKLGTA